MLNNYGVLSCRVKRVLFGGHVTEGSILLIEYGKILAKKIYYLNNIWQKISRILFMRNDASA